MIREIQLPSILFLDIETIPQVYDYDQLLPYQRELFDNKTRFSQKEVSSEEAYRKAGIYAEFGKIICISTAKIEFRDSMPSLKVQSFYGHNEKEILENFTRLLTNETKIRKLCAHNGKEFDFPYICRRMIINELPLPALLDLQGKKPWESPHLDTMELWKFGDYKNFTSLELLASVLNIPSPKDEIKGSDVARIYWEENNLEKVVEYCQKDVVALTQVFLRFRGDELIREVSFAETSTASAD